jgi:hypothetical protein
MRSPAWVPLSLTGKRAMCERCDQIDVKIDHYRVMAKMITDKTTLDGIDQLCAGLEETKASLHTKADTTEAPLINKKPIDTL